MSEHASKHRTGGEVVLRNRQRRYICMQQESSARTMGLQTGKDPTSKPRTEQAAATHYFMKLQFKMTKTPRSCWGAIQPSKRALALFSFHGMQNQRARRKSAAPLRTTNIPTYACVWTDELSGLMHSTPGRGLFKRGNASLAKPT